MHRDTRGRFTREQARAFARGTLDAIQQNKAHRHAQIIQSVGHAGPPRPTIPAEELQMAHRARIEAERRERAALAELARHQANL